MDSTYEHDPLLSIDMDDMGVRPFDWIDINKKLDDPINEFFAQEKTIDFTVYSAELQITTNGNKITTNDDDTFMVDDENSNDYDIDPETGEKVFREAPFTSNISLSSPNDKWIEEYLSTIESSSAPQTLPATTTTNSEFLFENLSFPLIENSTDQTDSDWFSDLLNLEETSDTHMFTDSNNSNLTTTTTSANILIDDEYSLSSSSNSNSNHQQQSSSSVENDDEIKIIEAKLEKIEPDEYPMSNMMTRRSNVRSSTQAQQDESLLLQYNIPLALNDITQSTTEEYNRHLIRLSHLTSEQMQIIKDIRRRGKNKIAAQNCRKRKAVSVEALLEEVDELKRVKHELEERKRAYQQQIAETRHQYEYLHHQVLPDRQLPPAIIVK